MQVRSWFRVSDRSLQARLVHGSESREMFEHHRDQIEAIFASQPDLPLHQDTVVGFVNGFLITGAYFVAEDSAEQKLMGPVLGGALLLGQDLPIDADPADVTAGLGFFERVTPVVGDNGPTDVIYELVHQAFAMSPDVPMTYSSLGGFCLGVLYTMPYLTGSDAGPAALLTAACELARDLAP
ncbi:MAG: hypothetical protein ACRDQ4_26430 [Pseudonocardiaceae bacterium]